MKVVLVHGAWADGSSWSSVARELQERGHHVCAVQLPLTSLEADVETTKRAILLQGATVVVGHSYGGFVISAAALGAPSVQALVYVAAYAPNPGETIASISHAAAEMPGGHAIIYGDDGWTRVDVDQYGAALGADLPPATVNVLAAVQGPTHVSCLTTPATDVAWDTLPNHYVVFTQDQILDPGLQFEFARRINARVTEVPGSHLALLSFPGEVADAIEAASQGAESHELISTSTNDTYKEAAR